MVITRHDLARLGRDVGLGARIGERRYTLEAFLGQDPRGTLEWLGLHASAWSERAPEPVPSIGDFWSGRAAETATLLGTAAQQAQDT